MKHNIKIFVDFLRTVDINRFYALLLFSALIATLWVLLQVATHQLPEPNRLPDRKFVNQ